MARYSEAEAYSYYVVRHKETWQYLRCGRGNDWGDYYNGATIYRQKKRAENAAKVAEMQGNPTEVVEIQIFENTDVVPRVEFAREIFEEIDLIFRNYYAKCSENKELKLLEPLCQAERFVINEMWHEVAELKKKYTEEQS